jgi:tRNA U34 5-methylaminomethyl-2-thiouridine-forming methyltransferase MnmC
MLFIDEQSGVYGYLALWDTDAEAARFVAASAVRRVVEELAARLEKHPTVRRYTVERPGAAS